MRNRKFISGGWRCWPAVFGLGLLGLLLTFAVTTNAMPIFVRTNEVWISSTNSLGFFNTGIVYGQGTLMNPYYGDYDKMVTSLGPYTRINLLPGTFVTSGNAGNMGDPFYKAYQKIHGSGIGVTTIQRNAAYYTNVPIEGLIYSSGDGLEVSDLTLDAQGSADVNSKVQCLNYTGNNGYFHDLLVTGTYSPGLNQECFSVFIGSNAMNYGNVIQNCIITNIVGTYCDGIAVAGEYTVCNNRIYLPEPPNNLVNYATFGINAHATLNGRILFNYVYGGSNGLHNDTGGHTNLLVMGNDFINCYQGITFYTQAGHGWNNSGLKFVNNIIELSTNYVYGLRDGIMMVNSESSYLPWDRILIQGNTIRFFNNMRPSQIDGNNYSIALLSAGYLVMTNFLDVQVLGNTVDGALYGSFPATGVWLADNTDLTGAPISTNGFANSVLRAGLTTNFQFLSDQLTTTTLHFINGSLIRVSQP